MVDPRDLFRSMQQRWAYRLCDWLKQKQLQAREGKNNPNQAEMIALRVRIYEFRRTNESSTQDLQRTGSGVQTDQRRRSPET